MKRYFYIVLLLVAAALPFSMGAATDDASSVLAAVRAKLASSPSTEAVFTLNGGSGPIEGSIIMSGAEFTMTTPQVSVWYDGKTQWTLLESSQEVSITEPSPAEVMVTNPFAILSAHRDYYTARRLSDLQGRKRVELLPRDKTSGISRYVLLVDAASSMPKAVVVEFEDGRKIDVVIDRMTSGAKRAASLFRYDAKKHPAIEIVDLR